MQTKLKQHLAIATGAASAAALPMGADAAIVYKDDSNAFSVSPISSISAEWDIDGGGDNDFHLKTDPAGFVRLTSAGGRDGRGLVGSGGGSYFNNIASGFAVGSTLSGPYAWQGAGSASFRVVLNNPQVGSAFNNGIIGSNFIGFRFLSGSDMLYGWAELILSTTGGGTVTVNRWAYNDTPNGSIEVGQTQDNPVPAPSTLALLAAGAFGIRRWRARRAAA